MSQPYPDPGAPEVVAAILKHQKSLTREQWQERLARIPGLLTEQPVTYALPEERSEKEPVVTSNPVRRVKVRPVKVLHK